jgi:DNA-binding beta-propeller fold protein YncE
MPARLLVVVSLGLVLNAAQPPSPLPEAAPIELAAIDGRIDHLAFDPASGRLFVAALGNNTVEVVDVRGGTPVTSLPGFREPQGIAAIADLKIAAIANGRGEGVQLVDTSSLAPLRAVTLGEDSDNVRYDAAGKRLYVGYGAGALAAIDPAAGTVTGRVALPAHPESFQLESAGSRIFVNLPDARRIDVIDRASMKVTASWPVTGATANFPMALDEAGHRLFVGCRRPAKLLVYDTRTGSVAASTGIVGDTDDLFFDVARHRLYVIGGEGFIDVLDVSGAAPSRLVRVATAPGARTGLYVAAPSRLFVAVPRRGSQRAEIRVFEPR